MHGENHDLAAPTLRALAPDLAWHRDPSAARYAGEIAVTLSIEALARLCDGHFPGAPVVPGAHLLGCLFDLAQLVDPSALVVERCVFRAQIVPDAPVTIAARPATDGRVLAEVRVPGAARPAVVATFVGPR